MSKYGKSPEKAVKSDTTTAKRQIRSNGYGKDSSVAAEQELKES